MKNMKENTININLLITSFFENGGSRNRYTPAVSKPDGYKPWTCEKSTEKERIDRDVTYLSDLTDMYELVGPQEYKGQTIPKLVPLDSEVGDDHLFLGDTPLLFVAELVTAKDIFGIQISLKDTFISSRYGNYSESYILKPDNISELPSPNAGTGKQDSIFLDIAKIRTIVPVCSMRQKHSDTVDGKVSLLGKQAIYDTEFCGYEITVGMCLQQLCLGLMKEKKFPYIPTFLGGFGSPPIFKNAKSFERAMLTYKSGIYYNMLAAIGLAVHETKISGSMASKQFLNKVKGSAEAWQDWYKVYTKYTPSIKGDLDPQWYDKKYYVGTLGKDEIWDSSVQRLLSAGALVTKTQLLVHDHMEDLNTVLLSPYFSVETRKVIEAEKRAQRQESIFQSGIGKSIHFKVPYFLEDDYVDSLLDLSKGLNYHLKSILTGDDVFTRETLDSLKQRSPTKVSLQMTTKKGLRYPIQFDTSIKDEELEEYDSLLKFVRGDIDLKDMSRALVEDDPILVRLAREWAEETKLKPLSGINVMVITTDDIALCKLINRLTPQVVVIRISPQRKDDAILMIKDSIKARYKFADLRFYDDEGSIKYWKHRTAFKLREERLQKVKFILGRKINPFHRFQRRLREVPVIDLVVKPDGIFDQQGLVLRRYNKPVVKFKRSLRTFVDDFELQDEGDE